jgi:serine/threonine-protein kinase HipA
MRSRATAEVRLHGKPVGTISYDRGGSSFHYSDDLLAPEHRVLGQIFEDDPRAVRRARVGLPAWFANLLPEGELRQQVVRELGGGRIGDFRLLTRLGGDLPGAVTVHGDHDVDDSDDPTAADPTSDADHPLRYSLAGVQLKYSLHSSRLTVPVSGDGGWWIVKLPDPALQQLAENEYLTMRWLSTAGFDVPDVHCLPADAVPDIPAGFVAPDTKIYLVRRFDRTGDGRVHVEDFAQVSDVEPKFKYGEFGATYDSMGQVVKFLLGDAGFASYVDRLVAAVVVGNTDAHLKNWALWYPDGRTPQLAPVYDFHSLTVYNRFRYAPMALTLAGQQMPSLITSDDFRRLADNCGADPDLVVHRVHETMAALRTAWGDGVGAEAVQRFPVLAGHYEQRMAGLALTQG